MSDFDGKIALVTAGSRGLGAEVVRQLAQGGADVVFTYLQDEPSANNLVEEIQAMGCKAVALKANAADFDRAQEVVKETIAQLGGLHILVTSAGIGRGRRITQMTEADWDDVMDVTLKGAFNYIRAVSPVFEAQQSGKIVSIGSINGLRGRMGTTSYNAAKAGLNGLIKTVASELGRYNVNANIVAPGFIDTTTQTNTPELIRDLVLKECAIKRLGTAKDIAHVVTFLCSENSRHVTGQVIKVDAGQYL